MRVKQIDTYSEDELQKHYQEASCSYICPTCNKSIATKKSLRAHIRREHSSVRPECRHCGISFRDRFKRDEHEATHSNEKPFHCQECNGVFKSQRTLTKHMKLHSATNADRLPCPIPDCKASFSNQSHVDRHVRGVHVRLKRFQCHVAGCTYAASETSDLKLHVRNRHEERTEADKRLCTVCGTAVLGGTRGLTAHMATHDNTRYSCTVCEFSTKYRRHLQGHMVGRHGTDMSGQAVQKQFRCPQCEFACHFRSELNFHTRKHSVQKRHKCRACSFRAATPFILKVHLRSHTGEKPYKCTHCYRGFAQSTQLIRHKRTHTGEKPYSCLRCTARFTNKRGLENHVCATHLGIKPYICHHCGYSCAKNESLSWHMKKSHVTNTHQAQKATCNVKQAQQPQSFKGSLSTLEPTLTSLSVFNSEQNLMDGATTGHLNVIESDNVLSKITPLAFEPDLSTRQMSSMQIPALSMVNTNDTIYPYSYNAAPLKGSARSETYQTREVSSFNMESSIDEKGTQEGFSSNALYVSYPVNTVNATKTMRDESNTIANVISNKRPVTSNTILNEAQTISELPPTPFIQPYVKDTYVADKTRTHLTANYPTLQVQNSSIQRYQLNPVLNYNPLHKTASKRHSLSLNNEEQTYLSDNVKRSVVSNFMPFSSTHRHGLTQFPNNPEIRTLALPGTFEWVSSHVNERETLGTMRQEGNKQCNDPENRPFTTRVSDQFANVILTHSGGKNTIPANEGKNKQVKNVAYGNTDEATLPNFKNSDVMYFTSKEISGCETKPVDVPIGERTETNVSQYVRDNIHISYLGNRLGEYTGGHQVARKQTQQYPTFNAFASHSANYNVANVTHTELNQDERTRRHIGSEFSPNTNVYTRHDNFVESMLAEQTGKPMVTNMTNLDRNREAYFAMYDESKAMSNRIQAPTTRDDFLERKLAEQHFNDAVTSVTNLQNNLNNETFYIANFSLGRDNAMSNMLQPYTLSHNSPERELTEHHVNDSVNLENNLNDEAINIANLSSGRSPISQRYPVESDATHVEPGSDLAAGHSEVSGRHSNVVRGRRRLLNLAAGLSLSIPRSEGKDAVKK